MVKLFENKFHDINCKKLLVFRPFRDLIYAVHLATLLIFYLNIPDLFSKSSVILNKPQRNHTPIDYNVECLSFCTPRYTISRVVSYLFKLRSRTKQVSFDKCNQNLYETVTFRENLW